MDEFIETTETIRELSRTAYIPIHKEADHLGLAIGDEIGAILFRPENLEHVKSLLYGSNPYLFFTVAGTDETKSSTTSGNPSSNAPSPNPWTTNR